MAKVDPSRAKEAQQWMETVLGVSLPDFFNDIRDGVYLCDLVNKIKAGTCKKYKKSKIAYVARTNIQIYLEGCKKLGVPEMDRFESRDLYDQQRLGQVVNNIFSLSSISRKHGFGGPFIGVVYAEKNERHFSKEVLAKSKSSVPMWNRGDNAHKTESIDGYGIIKGKGMDKHSGVQSSWEKGSVATDTGSKHDSYGIVKAKGMDKHSGGMSAWDQGSIQTDTSSKHDSYGIVKAKGMDKHSGVQSSWEKGSLQTDTASKHDSYGIVKAKGMDKHSGGMSAWDKGGVETDTSSKHDSYGIVRTKDY